MYSTDKPYVAIDESSGAADDSYVAINGSSIPSVATDESSGAADDASIAINDLSVGRSFWFSPSLI
ncbi:hypothetical protein H5410_013175 [Solanum commersonii]|uniref:Uncharacterized protein n=1 Tax=Solanum commersonii TaxID=4109 RepID=A0A9J6ATQ4_SOLCO|nr:hypothetical protein H5410_013175 [Solanum commersonii]